MKKSNFAKTILLTTILAFMQVITNAQSAELVVQTGHTDIINSIQFSNNGKLLASGGRDKTILWDVASGKEIYSYKESSEMLAFSPDEKLLASGNEKRIKFWDLTSGKEVKIIKFPEVNTPRDLKFCCLKSFAFSPDGKILVSVGKNDNSIEFWEVATGLRFKTLYGSYGYSSFSNVVFSSDGRYLAVGGRGIIVWDISTWKEIQFIYTDEIDKINSLMFSSNNEFLKVISRGKLLEFDISTGDVKKIVDDVYKSDVDFLPSVNIDLKSELLVANSSDNKINIFEVDSGTRWRTFTENTGNIRAVALSPDKKYFAVGKDQIIQIWNIESGQPEKNLTSYSFKNISCDFASSKNLMACGTTDNTIKLWDFSSDIKLKNIYGHTGSVLFALGGNLLISHSYSEKTLKLWDINTLRKVLDVGDIQSFTLNDKKNELAVIHSNSIKLIDLQIKREKLTVQGKFKSAKFSNDGLILAALKSADGSLILWKTSNGNVINSFEENIEDFSINSELNYVATCNKRNIIHLYSLDSGIVIKKFSLGEVNQISGIPTVRTHSLFFSPNGENLAAFSLEGNGLFGYNEIAQIIETKSGNITQLPYSPSNTLKLIESYPFLKRYFHILLYDRLVIKLSESEIEIIDLATNKKLAKIIALNNNDWAVVDPDGRFDASPGAQKLMHFVVGFEPVDLEQIKDRYYTPNLLQRIFKGENLDETRKVSIFTADELYPSAEYEPLRPNETALTVRLKNRGGGIGRVQVFVNGAEFLSDARPKGFNPKAKTGEIKIDFSSAKTLKKGEQNEIKIIARNEAGWLRSRGTDLLYNDTAQKDDTPQEFYAVIGGVSDYENKDFNLRYSAKDARDFARAVELGAVKMFGKDSVHIRLLASGADEENNILTGADSKSLAPSKENFEKTFEEFRKAKPTDVFLVYLAGHGTSVNKGGDTGDTYLYLTKEAVTTDKSRLLDDKLRTATTISSEELAEWIREVPALKRAMILDTCAAGAVEASLIKPRELSPDQIKALDRMKDRTGFYVLMGSAADAQSYEATRYGQGLLTYSLLQGMSGAKLRNGEYADVSELFNYATDEVVEMAKGIGGIQQPRIIAPTESRTFDIGQFSTNEKSKFTLAQVKPLVLQPQLSNDKLKFDNLKLSQLIAKALRDESATISRDGKEAKLVFVEAEEMQDAITPGGVYETKGDEIIVTLVLVKNNEPFQTISVSGTANDKEELSRKIVKAIIENASNQRLN